MTVGQFGSVVEVDVVVEVGFDVVQGAGESGVPIHGASSFREEYTAGGCGASSLYAGVGERGWLKGGLKG